MTRLTSVLMIFAVVACNDGDGEVPDAGTEATPTDAPTDDDSIGVSSCPKQAWPIDEEGHQLDRVWEFYGDNTVMYWMPDEPRAAFIMLHAANRDIMDVDTIEYEEFYNELAQRDIGYFGVTSVSAGGSWSSKTDPGNNPDTQEIANYRDYLIDITGLSEDTPLFVMGFSGGSAFTSNLAQQGLDMGWDMRGFKAHNGTPYVETPLASIFVAHINDDPESNASQCERQADLGYPTECHTYEEITLTPERFTRIPGISLEEGQVWFDEMVGLGMIDDSGTRLTPVADKDEAFYEFQAESSLPGPNRATHQLSVIWRLHTVAEDRACEEADFFDKQLL